MTLSNTQKEEILASFIEEAAAMEHERWACWQRHLHGKCEPVEHETDMPHCFCETRKEVQPNGDIIIIHDETSSLTIPYDLVKRWERQINTPYSELSEKEKESDRVEVRKYLPLIEKLVQAELSRILEEKRGAVKKLEGQNHNAKCRHNTPKRIDANDYDCSDIHLGYTEAVSEVLQILSNEEK